MLGTNMDSIINVSRRNIARGTTDMLIASSMTMLVMMIVIMTFRKGSVMYDVG